MPMYRVASSISNIHTPAPGAYDYAEIYESNTAKEAVRFHCETFHEQGIKIPDRLYVCRAWGGPVYAFDCEIKVSITQCAEIITHSVRQCVPRPHLTAAPVCP